MCPPSAGAFDACITAPNPLRPRASPRALPAGFFILSQSGQQPERQGEPPGKAGGMVAG